MGAKRAPAHGNMGSTQIVMTRSAKMRSLPHTQITPAMFQEMEKRRFDALESKHLARLEGERIGRNNSQMRFLERLLVEQGMTEQADELLALRNDCVAQGTDAGADLRIHRLIDDVKHNLADQKLCSKSPNLM